jgi:hypothetical protein
MMQLLFCDDQRAKETGRTIPKNSGDDRYLLRSFILSVPDIASKLKLTAVLTSNPQLMRKR